MNRLDGLFKTFIAKLRMMPLPLFLFLIIVPFGSVLMFIYLYGSSLARANKKKYDKSKSSI
jgi:hypothetical protein